MSERAQRACTWCGIGLVVLFFVGFAGVAHFLVPPAPTDTAAQIVERYAAHRTRIRAGLLITMFAAALLVPWSAGLFVQLRRADGPHSPLPYVHLLCGTLFSLEFIYLIMFWQVAAFRTDTPAELVRLLSDLGWVPFVGLTSTAVVQAAALGAAMLGDRRPQPVFPRWAGYFNLWVSLMFTPGSLCVFFHTGPFAFNGVLAWYLPVAVFTGWMPLNTWLGLRAITGQRRARPAGLDGPDGEVWDVQRLAVELTRLRAELADARPAVDGVPARVEGAR